MDMDCLQQHLIVGIDGSIVHSEDSTSTTIHQCESLRVVVGYSWFCPTFQSFLNLHLKLKIHLKHFSGQHLPRIHNFILYPVLGSEPQLLNNNLTPCPGF